MDENEMMRRSVRAWRKLGRGLRQFVVVKSGKLTTYKCWNHALRTMPPRQSSGLVEMQEWFAKLRR